MKVATFTAEELQKLKQDLEQIREGYSDARNPEGSEDRFHNGRYILWDVLNEIEAKFAEVNDRPNQLDIV